MKFCSLYLHTTTKDNTIQNTYMATLFMSFNTKNFANGRKFLHDINDNLDSPWEDKPFFPNLYKLHNLYTLIDFHQCSLEGSLFEVFLIQQL